MTQPRRTPQGFPRAIYVPWCGDEHRAARVARIQVLVHRVAAATGLSVVAHAAAKSHLPTGWNQQPFITRQPRTATITDASAGGISVYFWPTISGLATIPPHRAAHAFVIESAGEDLSGWARHHRAVHFDTKQFLAPTISLDALALYQRIDWNGSNGWRDHVGQRDALRDLSTLSARGELNPADLAGYLIGRQPAEAIRRLQNLVTQLPTHPQPATPQPAETRPPTPPSPTRRV